MTAQPSGFADGEVRIVRAAADLAAFEVYDESTARLLLENANLKLILRPEVPPNNTLETHQADHDQDA